MVYRAEALTDGIFERSFAGGIGAAASGGSILYIRKLYKACFRHEEFISDGDGIFFERFATFVYFLTRPLYSIVFGVFIVIGLQAGLIVLSDPASPNATGFIYTSMFGSLYVGCFPGKFLNKLETNADEALERFLQG